MPFISTEAALALALPTGFAYRFVVERLLKRAAEAERRQLMGIFSKYVSADVAEEIWTRRGEIVLAGQEKLVTVMFTDIRGFTRKTAGRPSMEVLHWLNDYFSAMTEVAQQHGGFVNKFIGDGIMILFGMPLTRGSREDAGNAVRAGLAMIERLQRFNEEHPGDARYPPDLHIGVGIHTGTVVAGNVGARDRLEYSAIGETVNLASRLESATKDVHAELVMSHATWELVHDQFETRPLGEVEIRGLTGKISLHTVTAAGAAAAT
jgi:adenylate cyclase